MKTTIDIPDELLTSAMELTKASTKRECITTALEEMVRVRKAEKLLKRMKNWKNFPSNEELEADDLEPAVLTS